MTYQTSYNTVVLSTPRLKDLNSGNKLNASKKVRIAAAPVQTNIVGLPLTTRRTDLGIYLRHASRI
jgi:hypothetical protein